MSHHKISELFKSDDFKKEKHVPVIELPAAIKADEVFCVTVSVGKEVGHPNTNEHHIRWIGLYFLPEGGKAPYEVGMFQFTAHGESVEGANQGPVYTHHSICASLKTSKPGMLYATSYCNIHGLWESGTEVKLS